MSSTTKGYLCGVVAAVSYGTNPLGALWLYEDGLTPNSVLLYRFAVGAALLALMLAARRTSFALTVSEAKVIGALGLLFAASSITYYYSFKFMAAGLASTILFFYPVMVAVIMAVFYGERVTRSTVTAILLSLAGIALLYRGDGTSTLSLTGMTLIIVSALTYAVYIVVLNRSHVRLSSVKLTLYVLLICALANALWIAADPGSAFQWLPTPRSWLCALGLGLLPTVLSLVMMAVAVKHVGSTPTAIMGALEPLTAVLIGVGVFGETLTPRLAAGIMLILSAVIIIVVGRRLSVAQVTAWVNRMGRRVVKHWRWR